jgi:HEAT repeat protein
MGRRELSVLVAVCTFGVAALAQEGTPAPFEPLLAEGRYREAYEAAERNGTPPGPKELEDLSRALLEQSSRSEDSFTRWFALRAMRTLKDRELAEAGRSLANSEDRYVQVLALEFLANADPSGSRDVFLDKLESPFRSIRLRALRGLERLRDVTTISRLGTVLVSDDDPEIRAFAARTLGAMASRQAIAVLKPGLDDANDLVREESVTALVTLGDETIAEVMRERLAAASPVQRVQAIRLARLVPDPSIVAALAPLLGDDDPEVRTSAAGAILAIGSRISEPSNGR